MDITASRSVTIPVGGMTCAACKNKIEKKLRSAAGVTRAEVDYAAGTASVNFDRNVITARGVARIIESMGYTTGKSGAARAAGLSLIIAAAFVILQVTGLLNLLVPGGLAESGMSLGALFVLGLLTSVHCAAMCGGINVSQTAGKPGVLPSALYNLGRLAAYTAVGFVVGAAGSVISVSVTVQGVLKIVAGLFMVVTGLNMLGIFPVLRKLTIRFPAIKTQSSAPLVVGLLNGLMPCGPLQSMQLYALSTGSPGGGAAAMFAFAAGTVPLMFVLGALSGVLGRRFTRGAATVGAVFVAVMGISMFTQGVNLSAPAGNGGNAPAVTSNEVQTISNTLGARRYPNITVKAGIPVKWTIDAPEGSINGCNNVMIINEYGIQYAFQPGENVIEFTPEKAGTYAYGCWMGMIRATIKVV